MALKKSLRNYLVVLAAVAVGIAAGALWFKPRTTELQSGILLSQPRPLPEFSLIRDDGKPFTRSDLQGHWSLVFTGFTHCPDVCPNTLALLKALNGRLGGAVLQTVFISVDPERDTPEQLARYVRYFNPDFIGATGAAAELDKLCAGLGVSYVKAPGSTPGNYTMDHSAALVLVNPQAEVAGYFSPPHRLDALAADLQTVLGKRG